jgi:hypothetical protein
MQPNHNINAAKISFENMNDSGKMSVIFRRKLIADEVWRMLNTLRFHNLLSSLLLSKVLNVTV